MAATAVTAGTATASSFPVVRASKARRIRPHGAIGAVAAAVAAVFLPLAPALAQRWNVETGVTMTGTVSSNPDLAPRGQEQADAWLDISPWFSLIGTGQGGRLRMSGGGNLGATLRVGLQDATDFSIRPSGNLNATLEAVDNFFFIDARAIVASTLDNPFLATTDPNSPVNTSTSYQLGLTPYIQGTLFSQFDYEVRSDNSWTDSPNWRGQYSATNTATISRAPQPFGFAFSFQQQLLQSNVEGQGLLDTQTARLSLRYAVTNNFAVGARIGAEKYNYTVKANDWQRFYGAEASWRPNDRTVLEGYWEDRVFGNSWQAQFTYRRPRMAFNIVSSRLLSNTPQQFLTFPGLANLVSLLDAAFTTRIPDPIERQRAIIDFLSRTQLPQDLLTPTFIYSQNFTIQETNSASVVFYGTRNSLGFNVFSTITEGTAGISSQIPVTSKIRQQGASVTFNHQMTPITGLTATANWSNSEDLVATSQKTTQTQLWLQLNRRLGLRTDGTLGARYQWVSSTYTNDATEAAIFFTLTHRF